jgi:hypothetical protein
VSTPLEADWKELCKKLNALREKRNVLAHLGVLGHLAGMEAPTLRLARSIFDGRLKTVKEYSLDDIRAFESSFDEAAMALSDFRDRLQKFLSRTP